MWFQVPDSVPLLVKILLTSDNLSVQVHPGDKDGVPGKTEMWHILRAEPGAQVAVGLREPASAERVRSAALSGEIMDMLHWFEARPGGTFFIPAGTIHAIGGGLALCEVQQVSDVTYRLFDYGRDRELHLDEGFAVASLEYFDGRVPPVDLGGGRELLAECQYFRTERLSVRGSARLEPRGQSYLCVALAGEGLLDGKPFRAGEGWEIGADEGACVVESREAAFLITQVP